MASKLVKVFHTRAGVDKFTSIQNHFLDDAEVRVDGETGNLPETRDLAVGVCVLTPDATGDSELIRAVAGMDEKGLPILALVEDRDQYRFSDLPDSLSPLKKNLAVCWNEGSTPGEGVLAAIKRYLGIVALKKDHKLFISYRQDDGSQVARAVYQHFKSNGWEVFRDKESIEGGEPIQDRIFEEICIKDLILLIDSPKAAESPWVEKEILRAYTEHISVCSLILPGSDGFPLLREMPRFSWVENEDDRLIKLEQFIIRIIAGRSAFDLTVNRSLREMAELAGCELKTLGKRRLLFTCATGNNSPKLIMEFEDAPVTLERLYRLYKHFVSFGPGARAGFFIHGGCELSDLEKEAVDWARGGAPLYAYAVAQLDANFLRFLQDIGR